MPKIRIAHNNLLPRATLTASSEAGSLVAANLLKPSKQKVYRANSTSATLTLVFPTEESISLVSSLFNNFTATSTMRARCYTNEADALPVYDSGNVLACVESPFGVAEPYGVNVFAFGGYRNATLYFPTQTVRKVVVDFIDTANTSGYVEMAYLCVGDYWSPSAFNFDYGASVTLLERSKHERSESNNLRTEKGTLSRKFNLDLRYMPATDRNSFWDIVSKGMDVMMLVSLLPDEASDQKGEKIHEAYCKLSQQTKITMQSFGRNSTSVELEEV